LQSKYAGQQMLFAIVRDEWKQKSAFSK